MLLLDIVTEHRISFRHVSFHILTRGLHLGRPAILRIIVATISGISRGHTRGDRVNSARVSRGWEGRFIKLAGVLQLVALRLLHTRTEAFKHEVHLMHVRLSNKLPRVCLVIIDIDRDWTLQSCSVNH